MVLRGIVKALAVTFAITVGNSFCAAPLHAASGKLRFEIVDERGVPLPCRIHLLDAAHKPVKAPGLPNWADHFVCAGSAELDLPSGKYHFEIQRGPEYERTSGDVTVAATETARVAIRLLRIANLAQRGWWSGELHIHRPVADVELLMRAEDLHVGTAITWWNDENQWLKRPLPENPLRRFDANRYCQIMAGEDEREGGALLFLNLPRPLDIKGAKSEYPAAMQFLHQARRHKEAWIDIEKPFWWDVPVWLASGQVDSIELANNHMCRGEMYESEAWGKPRDAKRLPPPLGNGYWSQEIYYHILNCGLRIPPSAGSASGVLPNPVGYNRVYVHTGKPLDYADWWQALKAGRAMVTNGPLLLCRANGELPGHVFALNEKQLEVKLDVELSSNDPVSTVEIIHNGKVVSSVRCESKVGSQKLAAALTFGQSGWFLVRAIADNKQTFRFASTAPFYLELRGAKRYVSRRSSQFFVDWVRERIDRIKLASSKLADEKERREVLGNQQQALTFWQQKLAAATDE